MIDFFWVQMLLVLILGGVLAIPYSKSRKWCPTYNPDYGDSITALASVIFLLFSILFSFITVSLWQDYADFNQSINTQAVNLEFIYRILKLENPSTELDSLTGKIRTHVNSVLAGRSDYYETYREIMDEVVSYVKKNPSSFNTNLISLTSPSLVPTSPSITESNMHFFGTIVVLGLFSLVACWFLPAGGMQFPLDVCIVCVVLVCTFVLYSLLEPSLETVSLTSYEKLRMVVGIR